MGVRRCLRGALVHKLESDENLDSCAAVALASQTGALSLGEFPCISFRYAESNARTAVLLGETMRSEV